MPMPPVEVAKAIPEKESETDNMKGLEATMGKLSILEHQGVIAPAAPNTVSKVIAQLPAASSGDESSDDDNVSKAMAKASISSSEDEKEEEIQSVLTASGPSGDGDSSGSHPSNAITEEGSYVAKGPMRHTEMKPAAHSANPYQKSLQQQGQQQQQQQHNDLGSGSNSNSSPGEEMDLVSMGQFLDEIYPDLNLDQISGSETGIPGNYSYKFA